MDAPQEPQPAAPPHYDVPAANPPRADIMQAEGNIGDRVHDDDGDNDYTQGAKALISVVLYATTNGVGVAVFCGIMHLAITISPAVFQVTRASLKIGIYILADALAVFLAVLMLALALFGATWASLEARAHLTALLLTLVGETPEEH